MTVFRPARATATAAVALAALVTSSLASGASAAPVDEPGVRVDAVTTYHEAGGYPILSWGFSGVMVDFTDVSGSDASRYVVTMTPSQEAGEGTAPPLTEEFMPYDGWAEGGNGYAMFSSAGVVEDVAYEVTVTEQQGEEVVETSQVRPFTASVVAHPTRARLKADGPRRGTVYAGSRVRLRWAGEWAANAGLTQVVLARPRKGVVSDRDFIFCEGTYCPPDARKKRLGSKPLTSFRVPRWMAGRRLTVVSYGYGFERIDGYRRSTTLPWGWEWTLRIKKR